MFIFFFSSRRRHTSFKCDWSSDVCSSDLEGGTAGAAQRREFPPPERPTTNRSARGNARRKRPRSRHEINNGRSLYAVGRASCEGIFQREGTFQRRRKRTRSHPHSREIRAATPHYRGSL